MAGVKLARSLDLITISDLGATTCLLAGSFTLGVGNCAVACIFGTSTLATTAEATGSTTALTTLLVEFPASITTLSLLSRARSAAGNATSGRAIACSGTLATMAKSLDFLTDFGM